MKTILLAMLVAIGGCAGAPGVDAASDSLVSATYALASFPAGFEMDDVDGDQRLVFTAGPPSASVAPAVYVARRGLPGYPGVPVGQLPPPPGGWLFPAELEVRDYVTSGLGTSGTLLVVDNAGVPPATHPVVYEYTYAFSPAAGFSATLTATHPLPQLTVAPPNLPDGLGYASGLLVVGGDALLTDALTGSLWTCDVGFAACRLSVIDQDFGPGPAPTFTGTGRAPGGGTRPYTLQLPTPIMPGIFDLAYVALTGEICTARTAIPGGVWCIPLTAVLDQATPPYAKGKRTVVPPTVGQTDGQHGVAADRAHPASPWLYWVRSLADASNGNINTVYRVNVQTLAVEVVAQSNTLMDFSTGLAALPPLVAGSPLTSLAVAMGQEENNAGLNTTLGGVDTFVAPSVIAGVTLPAM